MLQEDWLKQRNAGVGASDCAVIMGFSPWKSAIELYYEKRGEIEPDDLSDNEAVKMGIALEPVLATLFMDANMLEPNDLITYGASNPTIFHHHDKDYPWMFCSPDGVAVINGEQVGVEFKTTSEYNRSDWNDGEVPYHYELQCQHGMAVTNMNHWHIACLIGGRTYVQRVIERDEILISLIMLAEKEFWDGVQNGIAPVVGTTGMSSRLTKKLYPKSNGETIELSGAEILLDYYDSVGSSIDIKKGELKDLQAAQDEVKQELITMLGSAERGICNEKVVEYKTMKRSGHVVKPSEYRKFSIKTLK